MYQISFQSPIWIHFIGIGGISMSGFARLLHHAGFTVSGSDGKRTPQTKSLQEEGIRVFYGQRAENIVPGIDLVVYTAAIHPDNPELVAAKEAGIPLMDRAEMVGQIMRNYPQSIGVSGTHGKTTTTSMLTHILLAADTDPTVSVGGMLKAIGGNLRIGTSPYFLTEACEYTNSFLKFYPRVGVILNVDADHLDFFRDLADIRHSFRCYAEHLPEDGALIINSAIPDLAYFTEGLTCRTILTYGIENSGDRAAPDYLASHISFDTLGNGSYDLIRRGELLGHIALRVVGIHNVSNSLAAVAAADFLGISFPQIQQGLQNFTGTDRRFEYKGTVGGVTIIDDYAHHPTEITATLQAVPRDSFSKVWCVFQPHTYSRTKALLPEFAKALSLADHVVLTDIYAAREQDPGDISSRDLRDLLRDMGVKADYFPSFDEVENFLLENCKQGELLITMGAGDVVIIGETLLGGK